MDYEKDIITIAVVNFKPVFGNKDANLRKITGYAEAACRQGADLILFPEMALTGYDFYTADDITKQEKWNLAETVDGPSIRKISEIAERYHSYIIYGAAEKVGDSGKNGCLYNSAFYASADGSTGTYRKIHPFGAENNWCCKGDTPVMIASPWGPIGIGICYDSYQFPELLRYYTAKGARLYLNPTAELEEIDKNGSREAFYHYYDLLEYGVKCNTIFLASANLTGWDREDYFAGGSYIIGPKITPFFETDVYCYGGSMNDTQEGITLATVDLQLASRRLCTEQHDGQSDFRENLYRQWK